MKKVTIKGADGAMLIDVAQNKNGQVIITQRGDTTDLIIEVRDDIGRKVHFAK